MSLIATLKPVPTVYPIYRSDGRYSFEKEDETFDLLHPDDSLDGRTELHLFHNQESEEDFKAELEKKINEQDANVSWMDNLTTPDGKIAIFVEFHDEEHPGREILEFEH